MNIKYSITKHDISEKADDNTAPIFGIVLMNMDDIAGKKGSSMSRQLKDFSLAMQKYGLAWSERYKEYVIPDDICFQKDKFKQYIALIEDILERFNRVKERFFGLDSNLEEIARLKLKKKEEGKLLVMKLLRNIDFSNPSNRKNILEYPFQKFNYSKVIIKSIYDNIYPSANEDGQYSSWFVCFLHDLYNDGIQLHLDAYTYERIVVDCCGNWMLKKDFDNGQYQGDVLDLKVNIIGRLPYYNIAYIDENGDYFNSCPIIICVFNETNSPFAEICYEFHDYTTNRRIIFEKGQRAWISEYDFYELKHRFNISNNIEY